MTRNTNPLLKVNERQFQAAIIELAKWQGWKVFHPLPAQNGRGDWRTAQAGDIGFPDLVLVHPERGVIFAELKTAIGKLSDTQNDWLMCLHAAGAEAYVWRPRDINDIKHRLTRSPNELGR
jgi:hypothetical protein